jgi:hypothetical protein
MPAPRLLITVFSRICSEARRLKLGATETSSLDWLNTAVAYHFSIAVI